MTNRLAIDSSENSHIETYAFPLSFAQQRLWFLQRLYPDSSTYNIPTALRLRGELDIKALHQSIDHLIERHEVLRTTFAIRDGEAVQIVHPILPVSIAKTDLGNIEASRREETLLGLIQFDARLPFDLERGPLLRVKLIQIADDEHVLVLNLHHIVSDGWSMDVIFRELSVLYRACRSGQPHALPELPIQYADYSVWQRNWLQGANLDQQLSYWRKQLDGLSTLQLPIARPRPAVQTYRGASESLEIPPHLYKAIRNLSQRESVTLFMTLLAAFQTLLYRYCGQQDIVVGSPIAGRTRQETEGLIGFFVNTLVLRTDLSNNPSFRKLLTRVRQVALEAYDHQDIPFEKLVEELHPERNPSISPLFQVMFVFQNTANRPLEFKNLTVEPIRTDYKVAKFDLSLTMSERQGTLRASLNYNTDIFDASTIERMVGHFQTLLEGIVANPDQPISELPLLTKAERHQLLVEWNGTKTVYPKDKCIHELFDAQVEKSPDAIAVVFEDQQLTYRELNQRANQLAHYLHQQGVLPDTVVALCMERSIEMVLGILGVLKAGGAYLPIDSDLPAERRRFLLNDTQARLVLTQDKFRLSFTDFTGQTLCLDSEWHQLLDQSHQTLQHQVMGHHAAYVIYTSGSTGTPKGVVNVHSGLLNRLQWMQEAYSLTAADRVLQKTPFTFDVSVWEFLWPLISGSSLVVARPGGHRDSAYLIQLIQSQQITTLHFVPSMLEVFLQEPGVEHCTSLRQVICSGEALSYDLQQRFFDRSSASLYNLYGPTEASIDVTAWECRYDSDLPFVPIGRPIANTYIYILDSNLQPVPVGVTGELYIGGAGLARGYLNRPELTDEKFIANPFSNDPTNRLYKTGDLARYLPDGNIEFLGRIDNQVKIRGFRIELGEIEGVLAQHPSIQQAVLLAREDTPGNKRLVAYVVAADDSTISVHDLRSYLQHKLPDYMVPSTFVFLDSLPLTPNGKLDRKALPAPDHSRPELTDAFAAPRTPAEEILATIWSEVLKLDKIGIHDNFFDLGGHSLLATQVVSRINTSFQIDLPLRRLFESPTLAGLADSVQASRGIDNNSRPVQSIVPVLRTDHIPLSFAQERLWFLDRLDPDSPTYNVPAAFRLAGDLNRNGLEQSLNEVVRRHEVLRTVFTTVNGNPVQKILPSLTLSLNPIDLSDLPENDREPALQSLLKDEAEQPFDLSHGPLIRVHLWRLAPHDHVLALNLHHIVSDGWSMGVLFSELSALYRAYGSGESDPLPEIPVQYADYAIWQRDWLQGENLDIQLSYWKTKLDSLATLQMPTDHPRPAMQTYRGSSQSVELSAQLSEAIKGLSRREGVTLFMTLLAAFQTLLCRYCGQNDIAVGTPIAGRTRREIEELIGFFVNTLVLRADLSNNPTFKELLGQVRETTLEAYTHQGLPFEKLVEELHPERNPSISPLFQVLFVFQNNADSSLELGGLSAVPIRSASNIAKFDLSLTVSERDGAIRASLNYNTDLFNSSTIERMIGHFQVLLEGIIANPDQCISDLPLLTDTEKHQLLVQWNDTQREYPKDKCVHTLFEEQAERTPEAIAVVCEDQQVTYRELNIRANQLAHYLVKLGVGPEVLVAICLERSVDMIVALLAILKAGGAYLPLDPGYPQERLALMLADSRSAVVLSQQLFSDMFRHADTSIVSLDSDRDEICKENDTNLAVAISSDNLAYLLYTSGSTGVPKGVAVEHRNTLAFLSWALSAFAPEDFGGVLAATSICFDLSVFEVFATLACGGKIVLAQNALALAQLRAAGEVTLVNAVPSAITELIKLRAIPSSVRVVNLAGEPLQIALVQQIYESSSVGTVNDLYGPTECTTYSTWTCRRPDGPQTIGRPISNTKIYILDSRQTPVPIGIPGEIYIGGAGVARGYLHRPELTQEKFIANPFSNDPESRLYKTGDLARYLPDGNIEFLGRIDNQVKIRGFRIELGEIEAVVAQHPSIQQAALIAREDTPGDKRLLAYVVAAEGSTPSVHDLRSYLQHKLPDYMVPSTFVFLDSLPLTPNGKLDRKALPAPDQSRPELEDAFTAPRNPVEEILATIWSEVLKLDKVGVHDNFFHLGGHSLLATQVVSRIYSAFRIELPLRRIFESTTVAAMAMLITEHQAKGANRPELMEILPELEAMTDEQAQKAYETRLRR